MTDQTREMTTTDDSANITTLRTAVEQFLTDRPDVTALQEVGDGIYELDFAGTPISLTITITQ